VPITTSDLLFKLSIKTGSAGNSAAQPDPNASLGKYISTTQLSGTALNNLFDDVSGDENAGLDVEYRAIFIHNNHGSLALQGAVVWMSGVRCTAEADDDFITSTAHGLTDGMAVRVEAEKTGDVLPTGLSSGTTYFVRDAAANVFRLAATLGGAAINITADGGTFAVRKHFGTDEAIAVDDIAASAIGSASAQAAEVANENTAPTGVSAFSSPVTKATGLALGTINAGQCKAIWIRRTAVNGAAFNNDGIVVRVEGDTAE
jgi:hypothetical protein